LREESKFTGGARAPTGKPYAHPLNYTTDHAQRWHAAGQNRRGNMRYQKVSVESIRLLFTIKRLITRKRKKSIQGGSEWDLEYA